MDKCVLCGRPAEYFVKEAITGSMQTETITVTGAPTADGNITITITSANLTGSPLDTVVAILDADTVDDVATKVVAALNAVEAITDIFKVNSASAVITLTAKTTETADATLAFAFDDTDTTGATFGASTNGSNIGSALLGTENGYCRMHLVTIVDDNTKEFNVKKAGFTRDPDIFSHSGGYKAKS